MSARLFETLATFLCAASAAPVLAEPIGDPHLDIIPRSEVEPARVARIRQAPTQFDAPERFEANQGGAGTVRRRGEAQAFSLPQDNLDFAQ